jgi:UDP-2,3-diacylglucosamine hydrolase
MATLFVSDVHLSARRPDIVDAFEQFLQSQARQADAVYILGDLFDEWLGDDDARAPHPRITGALSGLSESGVCSARLLSRQAVVH